MVMIGIIGVIAVELEIFNILKLYNLELSLIPLFLLQLLIMILFVQISHLVYNPKHMKSIPTLFHQVNLDDNKNQLIYFYLELYVL